jgi:CheY-like chemotaxis protein
VAHVLVLSPDSRTVALLEYMLKTKHTVATAATGVVALGLVEGGERFDVIFAEDELGDMMAIELQRAIAHLEPDQARRIHVFPPAWMPPSAKVHEIVDGFSPIRRIPSRSNVRVVVANEHVVVSRKDGRRER